MSRMLTFVYGIVCYSMFFAVFLYLMAFVGDIGLVPKTVSSGVQGSAGSATAIDIALMALFGIQHSVMARSGFKRALTQWLPASIERSTYVLATNIVFILLFVYWQPLPGVVWQIESPLFVKASYALSAAGWLLVLFSTFLTNHFDLFGLRQVWLNLLRKRYSPVAFKEHLVYRWMRHPMMLGLLIAFWAAPLMTMSHLLFNLGMTVYIIIGIHFEEAGLKVELGKPYQDYVKRTVRFLPFY